VADLVEEDRAAVGGLEEPGAAVLRVGERALLVPKSSASRRVLGQGVQLPR
jgi:hypothetical protein